jgi:hypothetical protein
MPVKGKFLQQFNKKELGEAIATAQKAVHQQGDTDTLSSLQAQLKLYRSSQPFRDTSVAGLTSASTPSAPQ